LRGNVSRLPQQVINLAPTLGRAEANRQRLN
jgi:hypothetical protein